MVERLVANQTAGVRFSLLAQKQEGQSEAWGDYVFVAEQGESNGGRFLSVKIASKLAGFDANFGAEQYRKAGREPASPNGFIRADT